MKKKLLAALLALGVLASLTACGGKQKTQQDAAADGDTGYADSINILVYPDYVSEDVVAAFEQEYGIQVNITYLSYEEDNITRVETGDDFDIINPCQETVHQMLQENLLQKIDKSKIPNLANLYDEFNTYDYPGEEDYSVPYMCGSMSIIVNKDTCPIEITKWSDLADPALKGQIVSTDIDRRFVATTLAENGFDPNSENQADLDAVFDWLCQFNSNVKVYDNGAPRTSLENGDCSVAFTYTTDYVLVMKYPGVPVNEACTACLTDEYKELFKAFDIPESANFFTLSSLSSESLEMYDLFISNVMASSNS